MSDHDLRKLELAALEGDSGAVERFQAACGRAGHGAVSKRLSHDPDSGVRVSKVCRACKVVVVDRVATRDEAIDLYRREGYWHDGAPWTTQDELSYRGFDPDSDSDHNGCDILRDMRAEGYDL